MVFLKLSIKNCLSEDLLNLLNQLIIGKIQVPQTEERIMKLSCLLFIFYFSSNVLAEDCQIWFKKTGIKRAGDCLIECTIAETDMGTFHCSEQCADLCKAPIKKHFLFNLSYLYLSLNPLECALVAKYPKKNDESLSASMIS